MFSMEKRRQRQDLVALLPGSGFTEDMEPDFSTVYSERRTDKFPLGKSQLTWRRNSWQDRGCTGTESKGAEHLHPQRHFNTQLSSGRTKQHDMSFILL